VHAWSADIHRLITASILRTGKLQRPAPKDLSYPGGLWQFCVARRGGTPNMPNILTVPDLLDRADGRSQRAVDGPEHVATYCEVDVMAFEAEGLCSEP
jgi:hypothetical protein